MAPDHHAKRHDMPPCTPPAKQPSAQVAPSLSTASTRAACTGHGAACLSSKRQARSGWPLRLPSAPSREGTEPTAQPPRRIMGKVRRAQPPDKVCGRAMTRGDHITAPNCGCQSATRAAALRRRHEVMRWRTASWAVRIGSASVSTTFARPAPRGRDFAILPSQRAPHRALLPRLCWASTSPCA